MCVVVVAGGWLLATAHIVTAIIGAGVLGLPYALSWLGKQQLLRHHTVAPQQLIDVPVCLQQGTLQTGCFAAVCVERSMLAALLVRMKSYTGTCSQ